MSTWTGDPVWLADVLRAEGVAVVEYPGWRDRGHGDFRNIWGVMMHHTGSNNASAASIADGFPHLQGPLSQIHLARNGVATIVAAGVAWHAGQGSWPGLPTDNANWHTIGIEAANDGTSGWPPAQYDAYVKICAAIIRKLNVPVSHVIGHKEWAGRAQGKWDPGGIDMDEFRRDVQAHLFTPIEPEDAMSAVTREEFDNLVRLVEDVREQLTGARTTGYPGFPQGGHRTLYDVACAAAGRAGVPDTADVFAGGDAA